MKKKRGKGGVGHRVVWLGVKNQSKRCSGQLFVPPDIAIGGKERPRQQQMRHAQQPSCKQEKAKADGQLAAG